MKLTSLQILETKINRPQDIVYVVSYPNSGRTWLRALLSRYKQCLLDIDEFNIKLHAFYSPQPYTPQYIFYHAGAADIGTHDSWISQLIGRPARFRFDVSLCASSRILFLVRSPKDTLISSYHELGTRQKRFRGSLSRFIRDDRFGLTRWIQFYNFMYANRPEGELTLTADYAAMRKDTATELKRILLFSGTTIDQSLLLQAVELSSLENMRKLEATNQLIRPAHAEAHKNTDKLKVRSGSVGGWRDKLSQTDKKYIDTRLKAELEPYYLSAQFSDWF